MGACCSQVKNYLRGPSAGGTMWRMLSVSNTDLSGPSAGGPCGGCSRDFKTDLRGSSAGGGAMWRF